MLLGNGSAARNHRGVALSTDRTLYRRARHPGTAGLSALLVDDGRISWIGPDHDAPGGARSVDLDGALVLPGFVDAHVHVTETGLLLAGLDLSTARSVGEILDLVAAATAARPGRTILGHGWDELQLAEQRPPTAAELDRAAGADGEVYLSRVDVHSAVVSGALAERSAARGLPGWDASGRVERDAHHAVRHTTRFAIDPADRAALQDLALRAAVARGITEVHEMSAPHVAPVADLADLVARSLAAREALPDVVPYRGELASSEDEARRIVADLGEAGLSWLAGLAGDLMVDGSIGSRTAALHDDYTDAPGHRGHLYLDADQVRDHVVACTRAGLQAGFHVIGDAAVASVLAGFEAASVLVGAAALRAARHRIEHLEALEEDGALAAARLGLIASVQPAFDTAWGGPDRMYAVRLGPRRAIRLNPFATMAAAGVALAFGSDSPVTPFAPWEGVRAALRHRTASQRIGIEAALHAHTAGGHAAGPPPRVRSGSVSGSGRARPMDADPAGRIDGPGGLDELEGLTRLTGLDGVGGLGGLVTPDGDVFGAVGALRVGGPATFTGWRLPDLPVGVGVGSPLRDLGEALAEGAAVPECVLTVIRGRVAFAVP